VQSILNLHLQSRLGGKLLVFQSTLPSLGVGRLRLRGDDVRVYGTDKEHTLRNPEDPFYKQMAAEFTKNQIAVDIYAFSDKYSDIASLGISCYQKLSRLVVIAISFLITVCKFQELLQNILVVNCIIIHLSRHPFIKRNLDMSWPGA